MITFSGIAIPPVRPVTRFSGAPVPDNPTPENIARIFENGTTPDMMRVARGLRDIPDFSRRLELALAGFERLEKVDKRNRNSWRLEQTYPVAREILSSMLYNAQMPVTPEAMASAAVTAGRVLEKAKRFDDGFRGNDTLHRDIESLINRMLEATSAVLAQPVAQAVQTVRDQNALFQRERTRRDDAVAAREAKKAARRAPWAVAYHARLAADEAARRNQTAADEAAKTS